MERRVISSPSRSIRPTVRQLASTVGLLAILAFAGAAGATTLTGPTISFDLSLKTHVPTELKATLTAQSRAPTPSRAQIEMNRTLRWAVTQLKPMQSKLRFFVSRLGTTPISWVNGQIQQWLATGTITLRTRNLTLMSQLIGQLETRLIDPTIVYQPLGVNRAREHLIVTGFERIKTIAQKACQALGYARSDILHIEILRTPRTETFRPLLPMTASIRPKPAQSMPLVRHEANIHLAFDTQIRCAHP